MSEGCRKVCHKYAFRRGWSRVHLPDRNMRSCDRQALDHEFQPIERPCRSRRLLLVRTPPVEYVIEQQSAMRKGTGMVIES